MRNEIKQSFARIGVIVAALSLLALNRPCEAFEARNSGPPISGPGSGTVTSVTGSSPIVVPSGSPTPNVTCPTCALSGANSNITSLTGLTTPLTPAQGGLGAALTPAVGDIPYATSSTVFTTLADVAAGAYLRSGGMTTAPLWSTLILPNSIGSGQVVVGTAANTMGGVAMSGDVSITNTGATQVLQTHLTSQTNVFADSPVTISATIDEYFCNAVGGTIVFNLPAATGTNRTILVKKIDSTANGCTLTRAGADTIDGATTVPLTVQWASSKVKDFASGTWARLHTSQLTGDATGVTSGNTVVGGSNLIGQIGKVNAQGAIGSGGSVSCDLSIANICTFSNSAGGTVTINVPTNGVANVQYWLWAVPTAQFTIAFQSATPGWRIASTNNGYANPAGFNTPLASQSPVWIPFIYDGTNYDLNTTGPLSALGNSYIAIINTSNINSNGGPIASGAGTIQSTTGAVGSTGGGPLVSYGGTPPTCACTGGSPTCIVLAPSTCTGAGTAFGCCTGSGAGATCPISDNSSGTFEFTGGTAVTTCTLTFSASGAFHLMPIVTGLTAGDATTVGLNIGAVSTTTAIINLTAATGAVINYGFIGH